MLQKEGDMGGKVWKLGQIFQSIYSPSKKKTAILKPFISNVHIFVILLCFVFIKILMEDIFVPSWMS